MTTRNASTIGSRHHRRLSNYLLDRRFQLKYVGMIMALSSLLSVALGSFLVQQMRENSRMLQLDAELDPVFQEQLAQADAQAVLVLVGTLVLFNLALGLGALVLTHRMAGPLFVFRRYLAMLAGGKIPRVRALRKGDEFADVLEGLQEAVSAVEARARADLEVAQRLRALTEGAVDAVAIRAEVDRWAEDKRALLGEEPPPNPRLDHPAQDA
ncbi:MAG: hypothetical protein KC933_11985 [Myxococcales bacterium]|nr:hypothetical protein [Myxococcales bacterium]MCB9647814.1 hypothetical protein [Deltaproteobacteria bacterium]